LRSRPLRAILALRGLEVFAVAIGATVGTHDLNPLSSAYTLDDAVAFGAMAVLSAVLIALTWRETERLCRSLGEAEEAGGGG
jgi:hypothetical protein